MFVAFGRTVGFNSRLEGCKKCQRALQTSVPNQTQQITRKATTSTTITERNLDLFLHLHTSYHKVANLKEASNLYVSLIQQCKSVEEIRKIQIHMRNHDFPHLSLGNKLMNAYLRFGSIVDAHQLFNELPQKHIVAWNAMIACYIRQKKSEEAVCLYKRMLLKGVCPNDFTLSSVLKAFSDLGLVCEGQKAHGKAVVWGMDVSDAFVGSALVDMYAKFGQMRNARLVVDRVVEKDVVLFTALIVGYVQHAEDREAMQAFSQMIKEGIKANEYTFTSLLVSCGNSEDLSFGMLIHGLMIKFGYDSGISSETSLLTMYSKCRMVDDSLKVFDHLVNPNLVTWTSLIVGLAHNGREEVALSKFCQMVRNSVIPNHFTFSGVLRACSSLAMLDQGQHIHSFILKLGLDSDKYIAAALIDFYGKCGCMELARLVYDSLSERDLVLVNTMVYAYAQNGFAHESLELFHCMKGMRLEPNDVTLVSVLTACNNAGLIDEGTRVFDSLSSLSGYYNIRITREHYACMVDMYGRAGRLQEAESLINQVEKPDTVLWRTLLSACRIHGEFALAERILNKVIELSPTDEGTLILSSNLYASMGNWSQVIGMKSLMREKKLKKTSGLSWVFTDREIHTFMAGDCSHPRFKEINYILEELMMKVKELGYIPDTRFVLQDLDDREKERSLYYHSEKLAIAFALWKTSGKTSFIRVFKNLRVCGDCHSWMKYVTRVVGREIVTRDMKRFHHIKDGACSCKDYW